MSSLRNNEIQLVLGSDIGYLDFVQEVSDSLTRQMGFDPDSLYWIGLAVREAVTNAIQHGNRHDVAKKVWVCFEVKDDRLKITVRDQGTGVKESQLPDPLAPENLLKPGGRGIFFVKSFMDSVRFRDPPEGGHEIIMEKLRVSNCQGEEHDD